LSKRVPGRKVENSGAGESNNKAEKEKDLINAAYFFNSTTLLDVG
jgi:hypothetical protein